MQMPDFLGGSDVQRSLNLADNRLINLYPTTNDKGDITAFYGTPGLSAYASAASAFSGLYTASNGRCFAVSGTIFYEVTTGGVLTSRGTVTSATVSKMSDNGIELILVNGIDAWLFTFATNALKKISVLSADFTVTIASPAVFSTVAAHGLVAGDAIQLTTTNGSNTTSGVLTQFGTIESKFSIYYPCVISPDGNNLYVFSLGISGVPASQFVNSGLYQYIINTDGSIAPLSPPTISFPSPYWGIQGAPAFSPDGNFCFITVNDSSAAPPLIATYSRSATTGELTYVSMISQPTGYEYQPNYPPVVYDDGANGPFLYIQAIDASRNNVVLQYSYGRATGTVSPLTPVAVAVGTVSPTYNYFKSNAVIPPDGKHLYVREYANSKIHFFSRTAITGVLSAVTTIACGTHPLDIARSTDNNNIYVLAEANGGSLEIYTRNTTTGALTLASTILCGGATSITISADDTSVYIGSSGTSIYEFDRNTTTGVLTAMSTPVITMANSGSAFYVSIAPNGKNIYATGNYNSSINFHDMTIFSRQQSVQNVGLPTGLSTLTTYYVIASGLTANNFEVTLTSATSATFTVNIANPAVFTCAAHGLNIGDTITLTTTGALPTGLATGTIYYVIATGFATGAFQVSATVGGTAITTTGTQSGVHTFTGGAVNTSGVQAGVHTFHTLGNGFPNGAKTVSYIDGRFVVCEPNTQNFFVSNVLAGAAWDALNVQTADSNPDMIVGQITLHNELIIFCEQSGETFYDSGTYPSPFVRNVSGIFEVGCIAPYSIAKIDNSVMWLGKSNTGQGVIYRLNGYTPVRLSTYAIEYAIQTMSTITDAQAFTYQQEGHHFYVITFPTGERTFAFDINTGLWHERAGWNDSVFSRWAAKEYAYFDSKHLVCDYASGNIYSLDLGVFTDGTNAKKWVRSWRAPPSEMKRVIHNKLTLEAEVGIGLNTVTTNPQIMMRYSDDSGHTWSKELWRSMGKIGEYAKRVFWYKLGITKGQPRIYEISGSDPVKISLLNVYLD